MNQEIEFSQEISESSLAQYDLQGIYSKLAVDDNISSFDIIDENNYIIDSIEKLYDKNLKQISTEKLQNNDELINKTFVVLVKYCFDNNFKKSGVIFIGYCDYFDLDYRITFCKLHEKLQKLVKHTCKCMIGNNCFEKYEYNSKPVGQPKINTLFDLVKNKQ